MSTLEAYDDPTGYFVMAWTVGLLCGITMQLVLNGPGCIRRRYEILFGRCWRESGRGHFDVTLAFKVASRKCSTSTSGSGSCLGEEEMYR